MRVVNAEGAALRNGDSETVISQSMVVSELVDFCSDVDGVMCQ
jgi:hypothetical protein